MMTKEEIARWIVEQAVIKTALEENSPWSLENNVDKVFEAFKKATGLLA